MFYVFPRVVKPDACEQIVKDCKQDNYRQINHYEYNISYKPNILEDASIVNSSNKKSNDPQVRKTSINFVKGKDNKISELAWHYLREANKIQFNYDLEYFQTVQFAEYKNGGFYDWHQDDIGISKSNEIRKLSLTLALSNPDTFEGGELQFYNGGRPAEDMGEISCKQVINDIKDQGTIVVFDSRDWHRVTPVTNGVRHSLVCWTLGPNFK
tara:strand:+ start:111 stop:743 length:633 start_codon:yes stop_codon:yes gene_type:complete